MRIFLLSIHEILSRRSAAGIFGIAIALTVVIGWFDLWSGYEISVSFFYLVPIFIATWYLNLRAGYAFAVISIAVWLIANLLAGDVYSYNLIRYWNAVVRLVFFCLNAYLLDTIKQALAGERMRAGTDFLTGVYNRREFFRLAEREIFKSRRYPRPLTIVYFDIDGFKEVNDRLGHLRGDALLQEFSALLAASLRETDILARIGGDEFVILLSRTEEREARIVVQRIQAAIHNRLDRSIGTVSIGVVTFPAPPDSVDGMIAQADLAMYNAKKLGKNRAYFFDQEA